jgi:hypothetical protein
LTPFKPNHPCTEGSHARLCSRIVASAYVFLFFFFFCKLGPASKPQKVFCNHQRQIAHPDVFVAWNPRGGPFFRAQRYSLDIKESSIHQAPETSYLRRRLQETHPEARAQDHLEHTHPSPPDTACHEAVATAHPLAPAESSPPSAQRPTSHDTNFTERAKRACYLLAQANRHCKIRRKLSREKRDSLKTQASRRRGQFYRTVWGTRWSDSDSPAL